MKKFFIFFFLFLFLSASFSSYAGADIVILKDGTRIKGLILEEFKDRILVSTTKGEKTILKSNIRSAVYSSEEKNLIQKGNNLVKKGKPVEAYYVFKEVLEINPENEKARERMYYLKGFIETKAKQKPLEEVRAKYGEGSLAKKSNTSLVEEELGLSLREEGKYVYIAEISKKVPGSEKAELKKGDRIVSVWGEMTSFMEPEEVGRLFLMPGEVKLVIERETYPTLSHSEGLLRGILYPAYRSIIGASLKLYKRGIIVRNVMLEGAFSKAGIKEGDLIFRIKGKNTRYLPLPKVIEIIERSQDEKIEIVIRRSVTLWRKAGVK